MNGHRVFQTYFRNKQVKMFEDLRASGLMQVGPFGLEERDGVRYGVGVGGWREYGTHRDGYQESASSRKGSG